MNKYNIAVIGVGAVGIEMLRVLRQRNFPLGELRVFARTTREIEVDAEKYSVKEISAEGFNGIDIALFAGTEGEKGASLQWAPMAVAKGAVVIDNGADFRMDPNVPLVVPEVNARDIRKHKGIIANPNCSTIQMLVALWPVYKKAGIKRIILTTLQASSGAGRGAVEQLWHEVETIVAGHKSLGAGQSPVTCDLRPEARIMPQQLGFNVFPQIGSFSECDYTNEEWKLVKETHKIMHDDKIKISATTVRVPVRTGHSESVYIETRKLIEPQKVRNILSRAPGIVVIDDPKHNLYPMPKDAEGKDETFVGRIRKDPFVKNGLWLWVVADNLRKGAATNAVQIAECVISG
ncbi:MAG: aspartate-semialdehyde dehydrogenase [Omnitrophica WOR_2 bacterium RIFCSPHIGHO2_02_FULL_45_21]|nr:MAG: aspartate-semialdehyde dehydrogenase [Omnitrophica WOR_2 bacterium RIFCSPHIGHO2_02_FULL_45_21]